MNNQPVILTIIPVYNEKATIRTVVTELVAHSYQIIIVDDGSEQDIFSEISDLPISFIRHPINLGQGAALQTGFDFVSNLPCDAVVTFDGDGQHDPNDIPKLIQPIISGEADIVFGSRFLTAGTNTIPRSRRFILRCARYVNYFFTGVLLTDAHNGLRAFHPAIMHLLHLEENRMAHATELLYAVKKHRLRYREVGVNIRYTPYSKGKGQRDWNSVRIFSDLVLHKLFRSSSK